MYNDMYKKAYDYLNAFENSPANKGLVEYVRTNVVPEYMKNDKGHDVRHMMDVLENSFYLALAHTSMHLVSSPVDPVVIYVSACWHDITVWSDRKNHHLKSAEVVRNDEYLRTILSAKQVEMISGAIMDHRASGSRVPLTVYGKLLSSADRPMDFSKFMCRLWDYQAEKHADDFNVDEVVEDCRLVMDSHFGPDGYARDRFFFHDSCYDEFIMQVSFVSRCHDKFAKAMTRCLKDRTLNEITGLWTREFDKRPWMAAV